MIPRQFFEHRPNLRCYCQWCAQRGERKGFYKLRDGPVDWFFCNDAHALEWLEYRHKTPGINAVLKLTPDDRRVVLGGRTIEEYVSVQLSQQGVGHAHPGDGERADGLRDVDRVEVSVQEDAQLPPETLFLGGGRGGGAGGV